MSLTGATTASAPTAAAAALNGFTKPSMNVAVGGLNNNVTRVTRGAISLSSSTHLPPSDPTMGVNPVALPPGRRRLATKPPTTGSATSTKIIGKAAGAWSQGAGS